MNATLILAGRAVAGAAARGFAVGSMPGLAVAPWAWARWQSLRGSEVTTAQVATLRFRVAGAGLVLGAGWALTHGLWEQLAAWCGV